MRTFTRTLATLSAGLLASTLAFAELQSESFEYQVGDESFTGYLAWDDSSEQQRPGILLVHEWWGHNEFVREQADKLAEAGYTALALDMYGTGKVADHPKDAQAFMEAAMSDPEAAQQRFAAALEQLRSHATVDGSAIAAQGYCFGGAVVLNMARAGMDLNGVVSYHGSLGSNMTVEPGTIKARIQVYTGGADPMVPADQVAGFVSEMHTAGADLMLRSYPGVLHSFTNPRADAVAKAFDMPVGFDRHAAEDAFDGTLAFYRELFGR
ncbi:MAG: dienelactone hydrolase family protein [Halomonadaceae bacterium]|nr:MAG: dienelactone hydrolase family protein [Halomonadaceae bacterium]